MRPLILVMMILALAGCNLRSGDDVADLPTLAIQPTTPATVDAGDGGDLDPVEPTRLPDSGGCAIRTDWPVYTIGLGDTLSGIAAQIGSSVQELVDGNCLDNPDAIVIGTQIRVPRPVPAPAAPIADNCPGPEEWMRTGGTNIVVVEPNLGFDGDCYQLQGNVTLTISWPGASAGTVEVTFYRFNGFMSRPDVIGVDSNGADGWSIQTVFDPATRPSILWAIGLGTGGSDSDEVGMYMGQ